MTDKTDVEIVIPKLLRNPDVQVDILGSKWTITERSEAEDERLIGCDGYCDWTERLIVVEREMQGNLNNMEAYIKKVKRHEIIHAFLFESGLGECALTASAWATNEEMVDWFAHNGPKIHRACEQAKAL